MNINFSRFTYLGSSLNGNIEIEEEINIRITMGNRAYFSHLKVFKSNILSKRTKMKLYKTLIRPIVTHVAETWTIKLDEEHHLRARVRKSGTLCHCSVT